MTIGYHPSEGDSVIYPLALKVTLVTAAQTDMVLSVEARADMDPPDLSFCFVKMIEKSQHHPPCGAVTGGKLKENLGEWTSFPLGSPP